MRAGLTTGGERVGDDAADAGVARSAVPRGIGLYLASLQFLFAASWVVYVIYLPRLAAQAGLPPSAVPWLLMLDQLVFLAADYLTGVAADRVARGFGRLGGWILGATLLSCAALLALPFVAPLASPALFVACTVVWAASSSALRAPPLKLIGLHAAKPTRPALIGLSLLGLGVANAIAPYLGIRLAAVDPRVPFIVSTGVLAAVTMGIVAAERALARRRSRDQPAEERPAATAFDRSAGRLPLRLGEGVHAAAWQRRSLPAAAFAAILAAIAFQTHVFLNSPPLFLRHATPPDLPFLSPVFWIGFNLCLLPATLWIKHMGGLQAMAGGALVAAITATFVNFAPSLQLLVNLQFLTGGAWACVLLGGMAAAVAWGEGGAEGRFTGALASLLALAALTRFAVVTAGGVKDPAVAGLLAWVPALAWALAGGLLWATVARRSDSRSH